MKETYDFPAECQGCGDQFKLPGLVVGELIQVNTYPCPRCGCTNLFIGWTTELVTDYLEKELAVNRQITEE